MFSYGRTDMLALAGAKPALYSSYLRRGQLPFDEGFTRGKGRSRFRPHHALLVAAAVEMSATLLVDNGLAGRLAAGGYGRMRDEGADAGTWIGVVRGLGHDGEEAFLSGNPASMVVSGDGTPTGALLWDLAGSLERVLARAASAGIDFPPTLSGVIAADVAEGCGGRDVCPTCGR